MRDRREGYVPPKRPYSFTRMLDDLLDFASDVLVDRGRLAFWMPTASEESAEGGDDADGEAPHPGSASTELLPIPAHPRLAVVSVCEQAFNKCMKPPICCPLFILCSAVRRFARR